MTQMDLSKKKEVQKEEFYSDMDEKRGHSSCCTCQTIVLLFFLILIITTSGIIFIYYQITNGGNLFGSKNVTTLDFGSKVKDIKITNSDEFELVLTSEDLSSILGSGISSGNYILKDIQVSINENNILIYGSLVKPISSKVTITAVPRVENGKIFFDVEKLSAGKLNIPEFLADNFSSCITSLFDQKFVALYNGYTIEKIKLEANKITINGKVRK